MNVVINIQGREAIPVRAIPYVTGWKTPRGISPDMVAITLGEHPNDRTPRRPMKALTAYKNHLSKPSVVRRDDWKTVVIQLAGLSAEINAEFPKSEDGKLDNRSRAAWLNRAIEYLPQGVFVWLDEFEKDFLRCFDLQSRGTPLERLDERDLNLAPALTGKVYEMVMEGFKTQQVNSQAMPVVAETLEAIPAQNPATPVPVVADTTEQRRARWLDWYGKGERGAVQAVYERELLSNPKADRSFIGKEIKKAKQEKEAAKRNGAMFGQLVQDGKRVN